MTETKPEEPWRLTFRELLSPIEDIIEEARNGRMFILVDDEDRENEGDLVIPAQMATPDAINFMAKHGRGLICLAMTRDRVEHLGLPMMARKNEARHETAFTVSIEARDGIATGISAPDRARTIAVAIDPQSGPEAIVTPGHVFPVMARDGGVLVRTGHTEAAVDLSRMAGLNPSGVICEIMNDDGSMARRDDLIAFAQSHGLKIATIADLIAYRRRTERIVERVSRRRFESRFGGTFDLTVYRNRITGVEHLALSAGKLADGESALVRVHAFDLFDDLLGDTGFGRGGEVEAAMRAIAAEGRGVLVIIREAWSGDLSEHIDHRASVGAQPGEQLRDYGEGAQILLDLGVREMVLLHNTKHVIVGLEGYGLKVVGQRTLPHSVS